MQTISQIITKIIDFFYRPFSKYVPQQLFRYAACGGGNMVLDWVFYFILYNFVVGHDLVYITLPFYYELCLTPHIIPEVPASTGDEALFQCTKPRGVPRGPSHLQFP